MTAILEWLGGKVAGPVATLCALVLAVGLIWQTERIDGWPFIGGGLKADVAGLQQQIAARDLAQAQADAAALAARLRPSLTGGLARAVLADIQAGRVQEVDGWLLPDSVALLSALAARV